MRYKNLDKFMAYKKDAMVYPSIFLDNPADELGVVLEILKEGSIPILLPYEGKLIRVKKVDLSLNTFNTILKIRPFDLIVSEEESVSIKNIEEVLEVDELWI